ncbi:MAG TPA: ribokinase [Opitutus sp.]|nr:ribokinase [Opitutus sp.]
MKPQVVVVGSYVQDLTFVSERFPSPGETTLGRFVTGPGGKGSNQAVAAARAGAATRFVGAVGRDAFAAVAKKFHAAEGIDSRLVPKPGHATATAGILVDAAGHNEIVVAIGASAQLRPRDVPATLLHGARVVVCQHETSLAANAHVLRTGRRAGATTILNPAPMRPDFDPRVLAHVDVLIPNESEFVALVAALPVCAALVRQRGFSPAPFSVAALAALPAAAMQRLCRAVGVPVVIVTLGSRGCFVSLADRGEHLPAYPVKVVDSTGAGDAFVGGFAAGLVKFRGDPLAAARFGGAVAALSVTKFGTAPSMPRAREIAAFLRDRGSQKVPQETCGIQASSGLVVPSSHPCS